MLDRRQAIALMSAAAIVAPASPFDLYLAEIDRLAQAAGAVDPGRSYCEQTGTACWREMFDDGLTADDAWQEECWAAADMMG
jgi:predicted secreted protein